MKTKNNLSVPILSSIACLFPIILSFIIYNKLPDQIAIHWNSSGNPDGFATKMVASFGLPLFFLVINLFSKAMLLNDPKRASTSQAMQIFVLWLPPFLSITIVPATLFIAMGAKIPLVLIVSVLTGIIIIICGNYLPKSRQNYTVGIKLPWTLHSADNWNKTHRMAAYLWTCGGILLIIWAFISYDLAFWGASLSVIIMSLLVILPIIYSFFLYKKSGNSSNKDNK